MSLRILVIADPQITVPPVQYGGAERVIALLCEGLHEQGHVVHLMAAPESKHFGGCLITHRPPGSNFSSRVYRKILFQALSRYGLTKSDLVINFGRLDYLHGILRTDVPILCWFQNPVSQDEIDWLLKSRKRRIALVGVSQSQFAGIDTGNRLRVIYNSVDTDFFTLSERGATPPYVAFLGRLTRNKGVHLAIEAAKRVGMSLKIAGNISDEAGGREYFEREVKPKLGEKCAWLGPVDDVQKRELLQGAKALLFPVQWQEPFGLVMAESLACGTPVIAWRIASTPEIIRDHKTGFLCDSLDEMVTAIGNVNNIDRKACRADAETRFSQNALVHQTLELIDNIKAERAT